VIESRSGDLKPSTDGASIPAFSRTGANEELIDFRMKITERTHSVLDAFTRAGKGQSHQEVARQVLDEWAEKEIHAAILVQRLTRGEGNRAALVPPKDAA